MAREFQPLLLEDLEIRLPGIDVRRLAVNRHMTRVEKVRPHSHSSQQLLLYLRGRGVQRVEDERIPVRRGSLINLRSNQEHEFIKEREVRPVCLVVDLISSEFADQPTCVELSGDATNRIEQALHRLSLLHVEERATPLKIGAGILGVLAILHESIRGLGEIAGPESHPVTSRLRHAIGECDLGDLTPSSVAKMMGKSIDHINRQLKRESGVTIGQTLATARLERACDLLRQPEMTIGEVAAEVGYLDQNYFARWFRRHTGQSPSDWKSG